MRFQRSQPLFQLSHPADKLRQFWKRGHSAKPFSHFEGGRSADDVSSFDIAADSALRVHDRVVVNREMSRHADLSGEQHAFSKNARSGESGLRADDVVLADDAGVADLDETIDF